MEGSLAYQEERREELIGGKAVMMAPASMNHTFVAGNIYGIIWSYLEGKRCIPICDGSTVFLTGDDHFIPDFMVVCDPNKITEHGVYGAPDLAVEVLSPSTMRRDRSRKKDIYAQCGVREYWLVDPISKSVEVYRTTGSEFAFHDGYVLHPDWELAQMSEEERAAVVTHFKCSLFDDLDIDLARVFYRTL